MEPSAPVGIPRIDFVPLLQSLISGLSVNPGLTPGATLYRLFEAPEYQDDGRMLPGQCGDGAALGTIYKSGPLLIERAVTAL
jgi:hypothetical protein